MRNPTSGRLRTGEGRDSVGAGGSEACSAAVGRDQEECGAHAHDEGQAPLADKQGTVQPSPLPLLLLLLILLLLLLLLLVLLCFLKIEVFLSVLLRSGIR